MNEGDPVPDRCWSQFTFTSQTLGVIIVTARFPTNLVVRRLRRGAAPALFPALVVEQVAVRARPRVWLVADVHVRQVGARVVVGVEDHIVHCEDGRHADHAYQAEVETVHMASKMVREGEARTS